MLNIFIIVVLIAFYLIALISIYFQKIDRKGKWITSTILVIIQFTSYYFMCGYFHISDNKDKYPEYYYTECGVVTQRIDGFERHGKHNNEYYKEYLVVKYDDGHYDREDVNRNTYEQHPVNSRVCFIRTTKAYDFVGLKVIGLGLLMVIMFLINCMLTFEESEN